MTRNMREIFRVPAQMKLTPDFHYQTPKQKYPVFSTRNPDFQNVRGFFVANFFMRFAREILSFTRPKYFNPVRLVAVLIALDIAAT